MLTPIIKYKIMCLILKTIFQSMHLLNILLLLLCIYTKYVWLFCLHYLQQKKPTLFVYLLNPPPFFLKRKHPPRFFIQPIMAWFLKKNCQHFSTCPNMMLNLLSAFRSIPLLDITIGIRPRHIIENLEYFVIISNRLLTKDEKNNF